MTGWLVAAWLAGVVAIMLIEDHKRFWDEWLVLFAWPVMLPSVPVVRWWLRRRRRKRDPFRQD